MPRRTTATLLSALLLLAAGCGETKAPPGSRSGRGLPGTRYAVRVRGETLHVDPVTSAVSMLPAGGRVTGPGGIDCGISGGVARTQCSATFPWSDPPATVELTATPDATDGFTCFGFAGACGGSEPCVVAVTADRDVVVRFARTQAGLGSHPNWADGAEHGPRYRAWANAESGALDCSACHGPQLRGQGLALACDGCHAWPRPSGAALTWDQGKWDETVWQ